jgi:hypothetical protein
MLLSTEDLSRWTLAEVLRSEADNRSRSKELRLRTIALVNRRLAKQIGPDQYAINRKRANDDAAECRRGREMLVKEIRNRGVHSLPL